MSNGSQSVGAGARLTGGEAAELSQQLAGLTRAGLPLAPGLVALGQELPAGRLRRSMFELAELLEKGVPLEDAVEVHRGRIPPALRGLVVAGVRSQRLGDLLSRFTEYSSVGAELKRSLWLSLAYPVLTAALAIALFLFVSAVVVARTRDDLQGLQHPTSVGDHRTPGRRAAIELHLDPPGCDRRHRVLCLAGDTCLHAQSVTTQPGEPAAAPGNGLRARPR